MKINKRSWHPALLSII